MEMLPASLLYFPAAQFLHADSAVLSVLLLYFPAAQFLHAFTPTSLLYFPVVQLVQMLVPGIQYVPSGQHAVVAIAPPEPVNIPVFWAVLATQIGLQNGSWLNFSALLNTDKEGKNPASVIYRKRDVVS